MLPKQYHTFLCHFIKLHKKEFIFLVLIGLIWSINQTLFPYFIKLIINTSSNYKFSETNIFAALWLPVTFLLLAWFTMELGTKIQGIITARLFPALRADIQFHVFSYICQHSLNFFSKNLTGSIADMLSGLPNSCQSVFEIILFNFLSVTVAFLISLCLLWKTNLIFFLIMMLWFMCHFGITLAFIHSGNNLAEIHSSAAAKLMGSMIDSIRNISNIQLFVGEKFEMQYLRELQQDEKRKAYRFAWHLEKMKILNGTLALFLISSMLLTLIYGWSHHWVTLGDFSLIIMLSFSNLGLAWLMSSQMRTFVKEIGNINSALAILLMPHDTTDNTIADSAQIKAGEIIFDKVDFHYQGHLPLFKELSVIIKAGEKIGIVGFTGAGKSTFINLLLRLYNIDSGRILIDGQNISNVKQRSLRQQIAVIPQEVKLFHRSIIENIRYGRLDATDEEVINASKIAHCHEFIQQLDNGYHTVIGQDTMLSGGQKQRIAIARAILKNSPILILDEATSSLDSETEKEIQEALNYLIKRKTTLVIAHRLSTLLTLNRILVFDKGQIVEDGTIEELLKNNRIFTKLWECQWNQIQLINNVTRQKQEYSKFLLE